MLFRGIHLRIHMPIEEKYVVTSDLSAIRLTSAGS